MARLTKIQADPHTGRETRRPRRALSAAGGKHVRITLALSGRKEDARREMAIALAMSPATTTRLLRRAIGLPSEVADKMAVGALVAGMPE